MRRRFASRLPKTAPGFTMIEMMLVLVIIGILMGVVVYKFGGFVGQAREQQTKARLRQIGGAITTYQGLNGVNPPDLLTLTSGPTATLDKAALRDGWKEDLVYAAAPSGSDPRRTFELRSKGLDRVPGTSDDLDFWDLTEGD